MCAPCAHISHLTSAPDSRSARQIRSGVSGVSRWRTPRWLERVDHRVVDGRDRADRARLADALGAELVDERRRLHRHELERRQLGRRDHGVVGEVGGLRLAVARRSATASSSAWATPWAMPPCTWPSASSGLIERAGVVDGDVPAQPHVTRLGVDLDDGDVGAERERRHRRLEVVLGAEAAVGRRRRGRPSRGCAPACRRRGTGRSRRARRRRRGPRAVRGPLPGGVDELGGRRGDRRAAELHRARPDGEPAGADRRRCRRGRPRSGRSARRCGRRRSSPTSCRDPARTASPRCGPASRRRRRSSTAAELGARHARR